MWSKCEASVLSLHTGPDCSFILSFTKCRAREHAQTPSLMSSGLFQSQMEASFEPTIKQSRKPISFLGGWPVQPHKACAQKSHGGFSALLPSYLKLLMIFPLILHFVSEVWWGNGAHMWAEELCVSALLCCCTLFPGSTERPGAQQDSKPIQCELVMEAASVECS